MRQLLPDTVRDIEPYDAYRPEDPVGPLLRINMVASVDGQVTDAQRLSRGLGGPGDFAVFVAMRALADGILVGAGTVRAEGYGGHRLRPSLAIRRRRDGRMHPAPIVVVSRSLRLDPSARLFTESRTRPIVLTHEAAPLDRRRALDAVATVITAGEHEVDLVEGIERLRKEHGLAHLLCEGGPTLNSHLLAAGLADELCCTISPQIAGGSGPGMVSGLGETVALDLAALHADGSELFARYRIRKGVGDAEAGSRAAAARP